MFDILFNPLQFANVCKDFDFSSTLSYSDLSAGGHIAIILSLIFTLCLRSIGRSIKQLFIS